MLLANSDGNRKPNHILAVKFRRDISKTEVITGQKMIFELDKTQGSSR